MVNAPITTVVVAGLPRSRVGAASALSSTARQVGQVAGVAVFGAVATIAADGSVQHGLSTSASTAGAFTGVGRVLITLLAIAATTRTARARAPDSPVPYRVKLRPVALEPQHARVLRIGLGRDPRLVHARIHAAIHTRSARIAHRSMWATAGRGRPDDASIASSA